MTTIMYVSAILAVVIILTIIGVLSRYRRCKPNQVLVVYGKTGGEKKSAKLYHGGAAFVLPIIQSYDILSMEPMQIDCRLTGALSSQNIRVDVPTTAPALGVIDQLPIADTLKKLKGDDKK